MEIVEIAKQLAKNLGATTVLCYGSYAAKTHDDKSDIDLLILMPTSLPDQLARQLCYNMLDNAKVLELGKRSADAWDNSWSPLNDRLQIENQIIEIGYNTTAWVREVIDNLINKHIISFDAFKFRPYTFLGLLETCVALADRDKFIDTCKSRIRPIPLKLKQAICQEFFPMLIENVQDLVDCSERNVGILSYLFFLERSIDAAIQLLFIINDAYDPASKRTEYYLKQLKNTPENFFKFLNVLLPRFYENKNEIDLFFSEFIQFTKREILSLDSSQ